MKITTHKDGTYTLHCSLDDLSTIHKACNQASPDFHKDYIGALKGFLPVWWGEHSPLDDWAIDYLKNRVEENDHLASRLNGILYPSY